MRNGPFLGFVGYSGAHVNFEGKAEAAWSFFLRKTKSELPVSGWSTDCGEREGEREGGSEGGRGCTFPHCLCSRLQGALRDSIAEHGV